MSARWTTMVFAVGTSSPFSMMEVETSTSTSPSMSASIVRSSFRSFICPWATATSASGTSFRTRWASVSMVWTRAWT